MKACTWLCTIGRNLYLNECKKAKRAAPLEEYLHLEDLTPEDRLLQKERMRLLLTLIDELEEPRRQLLLLRQQGLSFREIGDALGRSETWARVSFFRLKDTILKRMEEMR